MSGCSSGSVGHAAAALTLFLPFLTRLYCAS